MGGKSRKSGQISKKLIAHIKNSSKTAKKSTNEKPERKTLFGQGSRSED